MHQRLAVGCYRLRLEPGVRTIDIALDSTPQPVRKAWPDRDKSAKAVRPGELWPSYRVLTRIPYRDTAFSWFPNPDSTVDSLRLTFFSTDFGIDMHLAIRPDSLEGFGQGWSFGSNRNEPLPATASRIRSCDSSKWHP